MSVDMIFNGHVIDIEASGLGAGSYPIEVGIVLANGFTYDSLIARHGFWTHWDEEAERIHGITQEDLEERGRDIRTVCRDLNKICAGKTLYSDCWVHDSAWLAKLFGEAGITQTFRCSPIENVLDDTQLARWVEFKQEFIQRSEIKPHRALNDAIIISETLDRLSTRSQIPVPTHKYSEYCSVAS